VVHLDGKSPRLAVIAGTVVAGKYRVERTLAEGGMGLVVLARHLHLEQSVALKFLRGDMSSEWDALARFAREVRAVAQLKSEHVAHVFDAGMTDDGVPYMVMEYLDGHSLARRLQTQGRLDVMSAVEYVIQACEGLAEAHSHGIVHRDIKPYNLFLVERSPGSHTIKIIDFGISKFAFSDAPNIVTGVIVGSPCYMSPEQLRSTASVDHRTDVWSLGATLYELLAGQAAFDASQTLPELVAAILDGRGPALRQLRADVSQELAAIVTRCLAKDREARFQSAGELAMALLPFAPARARVPAERAAMMKPAFVTAQFESDPPPATTPPTALDDQPVVDDEAWLEPKAEATASWSPRRRQVAILVGAAVLVSVAIVVASPDRQSKSPVRSVDVPSLKRTEAPVALSAPPALQEFAPPELAVSVSNASPPPARIVSHRAPTPIGPTTRSPPPAVPERAAKRISASTEPSTSTGPPIATPIVATGEVDSAGGRTPLRPIDTRDPYGSIEARGGYGRIETRDPYGNP
jgi:eukaryotic-like serine/threonine-protein kinase